MFCFKCGQNFDSPSAVCPQCGTQAASATRSTVAPSGSVPTGQPVSAEPRTDGKAIFSLILGIFSITCFWILAGIPAIILGHMSRSAIRSSMGRLKGEGLATTGLVMGYVSIPLGLPIFLIVAAILIPNLLKARLSANDSAAAYTVRTLSTAQTTYVTTYPAQGFATDLATLGPGPTGTCPASGASAHHACLIDATLGCASGTWCEKDAFRYSVVGFGSTLPDYVITATPILNQGTKTYCATGDGVVRYRVGRVAEPITPSECLSWEPQ